MLIRQVKGCVWLYECDWCHREFEAAFSKSKSKTHGCCRSCGSKASRATVKANLLEKHGVENVSQLPSVRDKVKQTVIHRYGVEHTWQNEDVKKRIKETMIDRHGTDSPWRVPEIRAKIEANNVEKYGVKHVWESSSVREKSKMTMIRRYGVDNPQKSPEIQAQTRQTCRDRYGVENVFQSIECREKSRQTLRLKLGVDNPSQSDVIKLKKEETSLRRFGVRHHLQSPEVQQRLVKSFLIKGKGFVSKVELRCLNYLKELFTDVDHQVSINGWLIDFYVKDIDAYVQFDGVYWHGLTLTEEQRKAPVTKRDKDIVNKWNRDRQQDQWFFHNQKRLTRITDEQFKSWEDSGIVRSELSKCLNTSEITSQ
jgi:hypothetical protein